MSLVFDLLKNDLIDCFNSMTSDDDLFFSKNIASAIKNYIEMSSVTTTDTGMILQGVFNGAGVGAISVDSFVCENMIYSACLTMKKMSIGGNGYFATELATAINTMMINASITCNVTGVATNPSGVITPVSGKSRGVFTSDSSILQVAFLNAFTSMQDMAENGNEFLATKMTEAITEYLQVGIIHSIGEDVLLGVNGVGSIL